jgi:peptide chain release factor 2
VGPDFWSDPAQAGRILQEAAQLKEEIDRYRRLEKDLENAEVLLDLFAESGDVSLGAELDGEIGVLIGTLDGWEQEKIYSGPYDSRNALISLHAGAGGTEAQDWVEMLFRMYGRWAQEHDYKVDVLDLLPGDEAGIKSITALISGDMAYGNLKAERGVHRLVRISPFDASGRRHTSFASVDAIPEVKDDAELEIDPDDLRIDTYRSSGHGGQHVNKTDSAVRITHLPTNIVVQCQSERSQLSNRLQAMKMLRSRLHELRLREKDEKMANLRGEQREITWGSQIRSYTFEPYTLVKDHRTGLEIGNVQAVMDGAIDPFIEAYLKMAG